MPAYLSALLEEEFLGSNSRCSCDGNDPAIYKCSTCTISTTLCQSCIVKVHRTNPFHKILCWNGNFFEEKGNIDLNLGVQLLHYDGSACINRVSHGTFTVVDLTGFHTINLESCGCTQAPSLDIQLLSIHIFPASVVAPKTGFTFQLLENFRYLHLEGKLSANTYMNSLANLTAGDNLGVVNTQAGLILSRFIELTFFHIGSYSRVSTDRTPMELPQKQNALQPH